MTAPDQDQSQRPFVGRDVPRREGDALVRGRGLYVADVDLGPGALSLAFVRSPAPWGRIEGIDTEAARAMPGVAAVFTAADLGATPPLPVNPVLPLTREPAFPLLAGDEVRALGQAVAAVLAASPSEAVAAAETVAVTVAETPAPEAETLAERRWREGDVEGAFAVAAHVVEADVRHAMLAPSPMEPRAIAAAVEGDRLTVWHSTQTPHRSRAALARLLGIDAARIRVIAPDVGGAFGMKGSIHPEEAVAVWAALRLGRPVRWIAGRGEEFLSAPRGRGLTTRGRLAVGADGRFLALRAEIEAPLGHWVPNSGLVPAFNAGRVLPSGYGVPALDVRVRARLTAAPAFGIYRGAGRPEAVMLMERLVDGAARASGLDAMEIRRRNLLPAERMPHPRATGGVLDSGDYPAVLARLETDGAWRAALDWRAAERAAGRLAGVGLAFYVEPSGEGWESARVTLSADGGVAVDSGSSAQGQSRATAYAQIAADALGVPTEAVTVRCGDTATCPEGIGALASRSTAIGGSAVLVAAEAVARRRDAGAPLPIVVETRYETEGQAWGHGAYLVRLTVDRDTGAPRLHRIDCVDDTGRVVNPALVEAQIRGGVAQGIGEALTEALRVDGSGQLLTGSFMDYAMPRAADMAPMTLASLESPSPMNRLGAKGVGEAGTIGAPAAIVLAALDALAPLGVGDVPMPLTPARLWDIIRTAEAGR